MVWFKGKTCQALTLIFLIPLHNDIDIVGQFVLPWTMVGTMFHRRLCFVIDKLVLCFATLAICDFQEHHPNENIITSWHSSKFSNICASAFQVLLEIFCFCFFLPIFSMAFYLYSNTFCSSIQDEEIENAQNHNKDILLSSQVTRRYYIWFLRQNKNLLLGENSSVLIFMWNKE